MSVLEQQIAELPGMTPTQLRAKWRECWRRPAPDTGPDLLRRGIAWKLQARVHGGLPSHIKRELERAADRLRRSEELLGSSRPTLRPGTRLIRQWQGRVHRVLVLDDGYEYDARRFSSLTQVATAITGTHWSGWSEEAKAGQSGGSAMKRRCAIYTRKSTEEGLEQAFNSLDAQREACAAYILSQAHEGWQLVNEHYDDGGWSGGNMARPALQQLLADIAAGKVDVIVVYKVDRLTRSLADFARIVEALDKVSASFVSVTQAFNTTMSMGRLTLNVLLSFAQFEREVTSERIRDKVAASKRKGMWMGDRCRLGIGSKTGNW
jgi:DNA invertase Pin-like site-specific DNA recombinase